MSRERRPTFREIAEQARHDVAARHQIEDDAVRPGTFDRLGRLGTPDGVVVARVGSITPSDAGRRVAQGAILAFEGCGCGGGGGCRPVWFSADTVRATGSKNPRFVKGYGSPTWIDLWSGDGVEVVFAHGDVAWGRLLI